jgi:hypothetical protein
MAIEKSTASSHKTSPSGRAVLIKRPAEALKKQDSSWSLDDRMDFVTIEPKIIMKLL